MGGMQMHHRRRVAPLSIHAKMQERFLGRGIAADQPAPGVELRQPRGVERAERGVGRRHQPAAVRQPHADVAGRSEGQAALEDREPDGADFLAGLGFAGHRQLNLVHALRKKSGAPKFPDFNANATSGVPRLRVQGTPGSISGPISSALTPSAPTTAPEVSPPATTKRVKPSASSDAPTSASRLSTSAPARSAPSLPCALRTSAGSALE